MKQQLTPRSWPDTFRERANDAYDVRKLLIGMKIGLKASGLHLDEELGLLSSSITKMNCIENALTFACDTWEAPKTPRRR